MVLPAFCLPQGSRRRLRRKHQRTQLFTPCELRIPSQKLFLLPGRGLAEMASCFAMCSSGPRGCEPPMRGGSVFKVLCKRGTASPAPQHLSGTSKDRHAIVLAECTPVVSACSPNPGGLPPWPPVSRIQNYSPDQAESKVFAGRLIAGLDSRSHRASLMWLPS
jgi:hypothetical protein